MDAEMPEESSLPSTSAATPLISQRIVSVDFYSHPPNYLFDQVKNDFNKTELHWVPVIRIFGATAGGQKACAHVHGVFPYMYASASPFIDEKELAERIDEALNRTSSFKQRDSIKHVMQIVRVKGRSYYGYNNCDECFFKIYFYTPFALTKAANMLANGSIMDIKMQPFESHIPYILQFFIDYNLFGMNLIHYKKVLFRRNENQKEFEKVFRSDEPRSHWSYDEMGEHLFLPETVKRISRCELEFDVLADDILNRLEKRSRNSNPGIGAIWQDEMERRRQTGVTDWANIPIPVSQERVYKGEIFEAEQSYRKILLRKLEPFTYLSKLTSDTVMEEFPMDDLAPASQPESVLPQAESQVSFSAKSSSSQELDDESVLKFFEEMAEEVRREEAHYEEHSILHSEELEDVHRTDDSEQLALINAKEPSNMEEADEDIWSQSFMSKTYDELGMTETGSARTDPVCITGSKKTREARREWNNEILESLMADIVAGKVPVINLEDPSADQEETEDHSGGENVVELSETSEGKAPKPKITLAQKLFPNATLRRENVLLKEDPSSSQESDTSDMDTTQDGPQKSRISSIPINPPIKFPDSNKNQLGSSNSDVFVTRAPGESLGGKKLLVRKSLKIVHVEAGVQTDLESVDFECQVYPSTTAVEVQTDFLKYGVEVGTNTDDTNNASSETQTDASTLDVVRTCGCRCNCGLMSMAALRANWEMAEKNKSRGVQTEEEIHPRASKRSKLDLDSSPLPDSPCDSKRNGSGSPQSSWKRKHHHRSPMIEGDSRRGVIIRPTELSPRKLAKLQERSGNRSPRAPLPKVPSNTNLKIFEGHSKMKKQNWEWTISNPAKFSPQFDAVTKLLKKQGHESSKHRYNSADIVPVSPRILDMSITSVYEYESPETTDLRLQRLKAAKRGLRLFEFKHQQMLTTQRENAERRRERKEFRDSKLFTKFSIREIIRPFKRTPQESFIAELVERDEKAALPDVPDYYANRMEEEDQREEDVQHPQACVFQGGNLSEDEENSQGTQVSLCSPRPSVPGPLSSQSSHTPKSTNSAPAQNSPRSILKSAQKRKRSSQLKRRSIRWGIQTPEQKEKERSEGSGTTSSGDVSVYNADLSGLDGPSPANPYNAYLNVSNLQTAKALHHHQYVTTMCVEVFCSKSYTSTFGPNGVHTGEREDLTLPDPAKDEVIAIFYSIHDDQPNSPAFILGMFAVDVDACMEKSFPFPCWPQLECSYFLDEVSMFNGFVELVRKYDPDILVGYEIRNMSWGYIIERGYALGIQMLTSLSRLVPRENKKRPEETRTDWNESISGRIVLNLWRLLRHEMTVQSYTFESAMFNIMHEKVGLVSCLTLNKFWHSDVDRFRTVDFFCRRVHGVIEIIDKLDLINRTSELARLFGIQFFEVFSRGSQFRVESMMLRLVKADNMIAASPTIGQRAQMRAPMELPLIMEPFSKLYKDPVAVLDFQSLYPSMMIAYNYDYSTCLGRVEHLGSEGRIEFGCLDLKVDPVELSRLMARNEVHISPTGVAFLKSCVKRGILAEMLEQILDTRQMVKRSMKTYADNKTLQKVLDSRQLGLKLIANVTYGYTSANFSGRMPAVEIADSVVSKGRETLERAIKLIEDNTERWGAKVIYGDTDSMFVLFPNCTRQRAFELAQDIADEVTQMNPKPVKLKLEKIYQPCILQTKKRYVGFSYETPQQVEPKYDAKGIETVRRDGCPAIAKILEKSLRILFTTGNQNKLRQYLEAQFQKILLGNVNLSDFTFAREYRGWSGYKPGAVVPALSIAERLRNVDRRAEPQPKERVPYVVIFGEPNQTLINQIRTPREFAEHDGLRINSVYYIERAIIPPLNRCFSLAGIDVYKWYAEIPRRHLRVLPHEKRLQSRGIMDYFIVSKNCVCCDQKADDILCDMCKTSPTAFIKLQREADVLSRKVYEIAETCEYCAMGVCMSLDCETWHKLLRYDRVQEKRLDIIHRALNYFEQWNN